MLKDMYAVIMAGGSGTRLWPMSRQEFPKQFIDFFGEGAMLQQTVWRLSHLVPDHNILIVTNDYGKPIVHKQLPNIPKENIIVEPIAKNTAPCIALASAFIKKRNPNAVMVVLPSDHLISDNDVFSQTIKAAIEVARKTESLVTIGMKPTRPETGFGYIQADINSTEDALKKEIVNRFGINCYQVQTFAEKPDLETAKTFIKTGDFFWNSGMFIWTVKAIWREFENAMPPLYKDMETIYDAIGTNREDEVIEKVFTWVKSTSIDYGVMEKAKSVYMVEGLFGWSDAGSWDELAKLKGLSDDLVAEGLVLKDSKNVTLLKTSSKMKIAIIGVDDVVVVQTENAILVCKKGQSQKVRDIVAYLKEHNLNEYL